MSAVKNLRAMFENKGDASPADEDRGRSLGVSTPSPTPGARSGSPKPLINKVRSSFVAVERNGVIGLVREDSLSRTSSPRGSLDIDRDAMPKPKLDKAPKSPLSPSFLASLNSAMGGISARSARASLEFQQEQQAKQGAVTDKPSHNPDHVVDEETPTGVLSPADPTTAKAEPVAKSPSESVAESAPESASESAPEPVRATKAEPEKPAPKETAAPASSTDNVSQKSEKTTKPAAAATKAAAKPTAAKTTTTAAKTTTAKTTATATTKTTATKTAAAPKAATKAAPKPAATATKATTDSSRRASARPLQKTVEASARRSTSAVRPTSAARSTSAIRSSSAARPASAAKAGAGAATTATKKPQPIKIDNNSAALKPKTRSPTKPVGLPASLTAPTASSVSKTGAASGATQSRQTNSRQSLDGRGVHPPGHSVSGARTVKQEAATRALKEKSAARSRPSIGPPPAKPAREAPKKTKDVDEGFLARMMRPTQASSSKTQGEPTTPPKKCGSRPSTAGTTASGGSDHGHFDGSPRKKSSPKRVIKKSPSPTLSEEKPVTKPQEEAVEEPVKDVAQEETAPVKAEEPEPLPVEEAAAETANVETVEEVVAIAEEAELTQDAPEPVVEVAEAKAEETPAAEPVVEAEPVAEPVAEPETVPAAEEAPVEPAAEATEEPKAEEAAEPVAEPVVLETSDKAEEPAVQASS